MGTMILAGVVIIAAAAWLLYIRSMRVKDGDRQDISPTEALDLWQQQSAVILDVRTKEEYNQGHIPGVLWIPLAQIPERTKEIPRQGNVLVICRSGNRSGQAVRFLRQQGFDNIRNIAGGMLNWRGPVEK
ncbi:Hypothetical protein LUCI_0603 [Lucifera butyrica]|uniref:Rhodanese domain-containing protein n=1 Tax=Lucifera butyrica TaxID=1351585 RepID=A0A498R1Q7_9FIRM|nr:rhodanese-like domain-containing protein [Lucifera butyrica]VBB05394.1 Hypothetical protein LUCI_0603 [Lucifera butyrica]